MRVAARCVTRTDRRCLRFEVFGWNDDNGSTSLFIKPRDNGVARHRIAFRLVGGRSYTDEMGAIIGDGALRKSRTPRPSLDIRRLLKEHIVAM